MKKLIISLLFILAISTTAFAKDFAPEFFENFKDVDAEDDFKDGVLLLKQHGIVKGQGESGEFKPDAELNRAELLKILVESMYADGEKFNDLPDPYTAEKGKLKKDLEKYNEKCFKDVKGKEWFAKYICYAKTQGWIKGYGDGNFRPGQVVNFVEALKMTLEVHGLEYDEDKTEWFRGIVERAANNNLIPEDVSDFNQKLRRSQMADMIARIIRHKQGRLDDYLGERKELRVNYQTIKDRRNLHEEKKELKKIKAAEKKEKEDDND